VELQSRSSDGCFNVWLDSRRPFVFFMLHENEARGFPSLNSFWFHLLAWILALFHWRGIYQLLLCYIKLNCPDMVVFWNDTALFFLLRLRNFAVYCCCCSQSMLSRSGKTYQAGGWLQCFFAVTARMWWNQSVSDQGFQTVLRTKLKWAMQSDPTSSFPPVEFSAKGGRGHFSTLASLDKAI